MYFETLIKRISPTLKRITYKLNGRFTFFNEDDLYQEALLHLWQDFQAGKLEDKTDSYILQGCYFHLKNYLRKVKDRVNLVSLDLLVDEENINLEERLILDNSESLLGHIENKILVERIQGNGFTKREKEVLTLCLQDLTVREIGKRLGISHVRVVKVKKSLSHKLQDFLK